MWVLENFGYVTLFIAQGWSKARDSGHSEKIVCFGNLLTKRWKWPKKAIRIGSFLGRIQCTVAWFLDLALHQWIAYSWWLWSITRNKAKANPMTFVVLVIAMKWGKWIGASQMIFFIHHESKENLPSAPQLLPAVQKTWWKYLHLLSIWPGIGKGICDSDWHIPPDTPPFYLFWTRPFLL